VLRQFAAWYVEDSTWALVRTVDQFRALVHNTTIDDMQRRGLGDQITPVSVPQWADQLQREIAEYNERHEGG